MSMLAGHSDSGRKTNATALACLEVRGGAGATDELVVLPGIEAWIYSRPHAGAVEGGDIHYVSSCFTGRVARFALADVSGHGEQAADGAAQLRKLLRKHVNQLDQSQLARALNESFDATDGETFRFATALLLAYFAPTDELVVCNAGHPPPLWYRAAERRWILLDELNAHQTPVGEGPSKRNNLPLGIVTPTEYRQFLVRLDHGDIIIASSDALIEGRDANGRFLGASGLLERIAGMGEPPRDPVLLGRKLLESIPLADDDVTLLVLHHTASEVPFRPVREAVRAIARLVGVAGD
jgi:serine phosphatase RsbU (regulator of sigma subunit)